MKNLDRAWYTLYTYIFHAHSLYSKYLSHFQLIFPFNAPQEHQTFRFHDSFNKRFSFLMISVGIERKKTV